MLAVIHLLSECMSAHKFLLLIYFAEITEKGEYFLSLLLSLHTLGLPQWLSSKESAYNVGDAVLIPRLGRSPGEGLATHFSILVEKPPWTEEPGWSRSVVS